MPEMSSPYAPKPITVGDELVERYRAVGFSVVGEAPPAEPAEARPVPSATGPAESKAPASSASRGDWAAYAESVGVEPGDLTKAELQAAVKAAE